MRTTLVLSDAAYEVARAHAEFQRRSLGDVISEMILRPTSSRSKLSGPDKLGFVTFTTEEPLTVKRVKELLDDD